MVFRYSQITPQRHIKTIVALILLLSLVIISFVKVNSGNTESLPDITISIDGNSKIVNSTFNFGNVAVSEISQVTVEITNNGSGTLNLTGDPTAEVIGGDAGQFEVDLPSVGVADYQNALSTEVTHTCAINSLGAAVCWGNNSHDQTNVPAGLDSGVQAIGAADIHTCAINSSGAVVCWGDNGYGQTNVPAGLDSGVQAIRSGNWVTCAINSSGAAVCWGYTGYDQTNVPAGLDSGVQAIDAGRNYACAINSSGAVVCWGGNDFGQTNVPAGLDSGVQAIDAGRNHSCAIDSSGAAVCWGYNAFGQTDVPAGLDSGVQAISAGGFHTCAINSLGAVVCWGQNSYGETNVPAGLDSGVQAIGAGNNHSCAINSSGAVVCWGRNNYGQTNVPAGLDSGVGSTLEGLNVELENGESTSFTLKFAPLEVGEFTTTLSIPNNDTDKNPYTVTILGVGISVPGAPTTLGATTASPSQINLSWTAPASDGGSAITGYRIQRKIGAGEFTDLVANTANTNTTYSDTSLDIDTTYTYRILAINAEGQSDWSNEASATTSIDAQQPAIFFGFSF